MAIDKVSYECDILYSYRLPKEYENAVSVGTRVTVPFGRGNSCRCAIVMELEAGSDQNELKSIYAVQDKAPLISAEMPELIKWLKERYFCTYFECAKLVLPAGLGDASKSAKYSLNSNCKPEPELSAEEKSFIELLHGLNKNFVSIKEISELKIKNHNSIVFSLLRKNVITEKSSYAKNVGNREKIMLKALAYKDFADTIALPVRQKAAYDYIKKSDAVSLKEVQYFTGVSISCINALIKKNLVNKFTVSQYCSPPGNTTVCERKAPSSLTPEQQDVFDAMMKKYKKSEYGVSLLHGITGSGKTEILLRMIDYVISINKSAVFMVPEIALTAQFVGVFKARYGNIVSVLHSGLSDWERFDEWQKIKSGTSKIVLGTRSAVFAPIKNLGLIVIDEEHEFTYKSEFSPRFNAKEVAAYRCKKNNCELVLSSATPSVESYYKAVSGKYSLFELKSRYNAHPLPKVKIIDMNRAPMTHKSSQFSDELIEALKKNISQKKQSLLLFNRRGYNTFVKCGNCSEVVLCPNCSVSMNYHKSNNRLMCHCCGHSYPFMSVCPTCHMESLKYFGTGTQKTEDVLKSILPYAKILRMDSDVGATNKKGRGAFKDFSDGKYDILLGTQMISKGFNFPGVTLVGVLDADRSLYGSDFRSYERTFSLLTQVIGRSGRGSDIGTAMIQTFTPESEIIEYASIQDYKKFFDSEITLRKALLYPPFADICRVVINSGHEKNAIESSKTFFAYLKDVACQSYSDIPLRIFSPAPALVKKAMRIYRYKIIIKCKNSLKFRTMMRETLNKYYADKRMRRAKVFVDINPDTIL